MWMASSTTIANKIDIQDDDDRETILYDELEVEEQRREECDLVNQYADVMVDTVEDDQFTNMAAEHIVRRGQWGTKLYRAVEAYFGSTKCTRCYHGRT